MQLIDINPDNPQENKIQRVVEALRKGAIIIYPTDSKYAFGCDLFNKDAIEKLCQLKNEKPEKMQFSFICKDISQVSEYARQFDNSIFSEEAQMVLIIKQMFYSSNSSSFVSLIYLLGITPNCFLKHLEKYEAVLKPVMYMISFTDKSLFSKS